MTKNPIKTLTLIFLGLAFMAMMSATLWFLFCAEWSRAFSCFVGMLMSSWLIQVFTKEEAK